MNTSQESSELPNAAQTLSSLAEVDIETAELFLEQTLTHFPSDASLTRRSIVDKMSAMAKEYSISMHDLFLASGRSIGVADAVGVSFKGLLEAIAVLGTVGDMRGSHAGHVLRNLLLRFQERGYVCRNGRFALASPSKEEEVAPDRPRVSPESKTTLTTRNPFATAEVEKRVFAANVSEYGKVLSVDPVETSHTLTVE